MNIISLFIVLQLILLFFMTFHDWVHIPPLTNIRDLEKSFLTSTPNYLGIEDFLIQKPGKINSASGLLN